MQITRLVNVLIGHSDSPHPPPSLPEQQFSITSDSFLNLTFFSSASNQSILDVSMEISSRIEIVSDLPLFQILLLIYIFRFSWKSAVGSSPLALFSGFCNYKLLFCNYNFFLQNYSLASIRNKQATMYCRALCRTKGVNS